MKEKIKLTCFLSVDRDKTNLYIYYKKYESDRFVYYSKNPFKFRVRNLECRKYENWTLVQKYYKYILKNENRNNTKTNWICYIWKPFFLHPSRNKSNYLFKIHVVDFIRKKCWYRRISQRVSYHRTCIKLSWLTATGHQKTSGFKQVEERHPVIYGRSERQRTPFPARKNPHYNSAGFVIDLSF